MENFNIHLTLFNSEYMLKNNKLINHFLTECLNYLGLWFRNKGVLSGLNILFISHALPWLIYISIYI